MDISKEIKKILIEKDMTLTDLANKLGTSQQNISAKLKKNNPRISELKEITDALGYEFRIEFTEK